MDFNFLNFCNRLLMIAKRPPVTSFSTTVNADEYRCRLAINDAVQDLALLLRIKSRLIEFTFDTVASTRTYILPKRVMYPLYDLRQKESDVQLRQMVANDFGKFFPDDDDSGDPEWYYLEEAVGVNNQPASTGEQVYCVSSSASDTSVVVIQGYDTSNNYIVDEVTLSGTTAVASSSTFKFISSISKIVTTGTITFRNSGSTTTYLTLSPKEYIRRSIMIGLHPIPDSAITIYGKGWEKIPALVNEYDVPVGLDTMHINAIIAGGIFHYMKYDPVVQRESLAGYKQDFYDEVKKIISVDKRDRVQHYMRSPYWSKRPKLTRI